jgi:hypothetical protein
MKISFEGDDEEFFVQATLGSRADAERLIKVLQELSRSLWPHGPAEPPFSPPWESERLDINMPIVEPPPREEPF